MERAPAQNIALKGQNMNGRSRQRRQLALWPGRFQDLIAGTEIPELHLRKITSTDKEVRNDVLYPLTSC